MAQPAEPIRVIYAKLTSTGDYDVVAKTANIDLNAARSLAEKLLLGNVPHEATIGEEIAYLRHGDGGHVFIRYTTYNWKDENRGGAFMTDIVWVNDTDFARARNNAFAMIPKSDDVYDVLTTLPPVVIPAASADDDIKRISEMRAAESGTVTILAAPVLRDAPILSVDAADQKHALEFFTLLLPPSARTFLTFQTRAFRVPAFPPRITFADAMHANLQNGPWAHVHPDVSRDVPIALARQFVDTASRPNAVRVAQKLYDESGGPSKDMRSEVTRYVDLVAFADALERGDAANAFRLAGSGSALESETRLAEVFRRMPAAEVRASILENVAAGTAGEALALRMLRAVRKSDHATAATLEQDAARHLVSQSHMPGAELASHLIKSLAEAGNANTIILFLALDPDAAAATIPASLPETPLGSFLGVLQSASRNKRDISIARRVMESVTTLTPSVTDPSAASRLSMISRTAVDAALEKLVVRAADVREMRALQKAVDGLYPAVAKSTASRDAIPMIFADTQIAALENDALTELAASRAERLHGEAVAVMAAALVHHALEDSDPRMRALRISAATTLLTHVPGPMRIQVQRTLDELGVGADALLNAKGGEQLLPMLGRSTEQVASTRDILQALRELGDSDEAIARLATAVLAARAGQLQLTKSHQALAPLHAALADTMNKRRTGGSHAAVAEIALDLLATVCDAEAFADLEAAALGNGGVTVRLRRLDRAIALCRAAEDETAYEQLALAIESSDTAISEASRARLRDALGTGGLQRRLIQMITGVVERNPQ